jgi:hypothetical protein
MNHPGLIEKESGARELNDPRLLSYLKANRSRASGFKKTS